MAYTDDWENLMNGVFGPGGKLRFDTQKTPPEKKENNPKLPCHPTTAEKGTVIITLAQNVDNPLPEASQPAASAAKNAHTIPE